MGRGVRPSFFIRRCEILACLFEERGGTRAIPLEVRALLPTEVGVERENFKDIEGELRYYPLVFMLGQKKVGRSLEGGSLHRSSIINALSLPPSLVVNVMNISVMHRQT